MENGILEAKEILYNGTEIKIGSKITIKEMGKIATDGTVLKYSNTITN
jgi:cation transport ATPase